MDGSEFISVSCQSCRKGLVSQFPSSISLCVYETVCLKRKILELAGEQRGVFFHSIVYKGRLKQGVSIIRKKIRMSKDRHATVL